MIILNKGRVVIPSVEQTLGILNANLDTRPIYVDYDKVVYRIYDFTTRVIHKELEFKDRYGLPPTTLNIKSLIVERNLTDKFDITPTGELSLNKESVEGAMLTLSEDDQIMVSLYREVASLTKKRNTLVSLLQNPMSELTSFDGHRMLELRPEWVSQNTGRVGMTNPAVQNFDHDLQDIFTAPYGYRLLHTDSGQIEPRISYSWIIPDPQLKTLINLYDDAYYGVYHYCTMPESVINSGTTEFEKLELTDDVKKARQLIKRYTNAVMYGSRSEEDNVKIAMIQRIGEHPMRLQYVNMLKQQIRSGQTVFNTYFGTPIDISKSQKYPRYNDNLEQKVKLAINNPIQGTAADCMRMSVIAADRLCQSYPGNSSVAYYVHDAGVFYVAEDQIDTLGKELQDIVAYQIDDFIPVHSEYEWIEHDTKMKY